MKWTPSSSEVERRNRIRISIAAVAYEMYSDPIISDAEFDELALKIRPDMSTGTRSRDKKHDEFFRTEFSPDTGQWIYKHPFLTKTKNLYMFGRTKGWWTK